MAIVKGILIIMVLGLIACSNDNIEGKYLPNMESLLNPKLKRSQKLFSSYRINVSLTINSDKAIMEIKGRGIVNKKELRLKRKGGKIIISGADDKSVVAEFVSNGNHSIRCIKCPSRMPVIWTRVTDSTAVSASSK